MDWRSALTRNWPYKVASLVLALLLWLNVTAEEGGEFSLRTEVRVEVADSGWVATTVRPRYVETVFRGPRGILYPANLPYVRQVIDSVTADEMRLELSPRMVEGLDGEMKLNPVAVRPQTVEVLLEPRVERKVAVAPRLTLDAAEGFAVVPPVVLQPESVTVRGPESEIAALDSVRTEPASLEDLRRTVTRELQLVPPSDSGRIGLSPTTILATVEVDTAAERTVAVPLEVEGTAGPRVETSTDSVLVQLQGAAGLLQRITVGSVHARVVVDSVPPAEASLPVEVELPAGSPLRALADPQRVTVRPGATPDPGAEAP